VVGLVSHTHSRSHVPTRAAYGRSMVGGLIAGWMLSLAVSVGAATSVVEEVVSPPPVGQVEIEADKLEYDDASGWAEGTGNVRVRRSMDSLTADYVRVNMSSEEAEAFGNVVLTRPTGVTRGAHLVYNFRTQQGVSEDMGGVAAPFYWVSESAERVSTNTYVLHDAEVTTCQYPDRGRHFHVKAREITIRPEQWMKAKHAVWYFGRVPSFYLPYWRRSLKDAGCGWQIEPGYSTRMGAYALSTYGCTVLPWLRTETHLDYRTRRGVGVGQGFQWHQPGTTWSGDIDLYYLDDKRPIDPDEDAATSDIGHSRHRIRLRHSYYPSVNNYVLLQAFHLSDTDVQEDFFESEYRYGYQPDNYLIYTHRGDGYLAHLQVRKRLNDFYSKMERLPELSVDVFRQPIGTSGFYYEGAASLGYLQQNWDESSTAEDYASVRGDTSHRFYYPYKLWGFLNMVPRVGYRGTWYSDGVDGGGVRTLVELGHEVSFKAFKIWPQVGASQSAYRHIVEPYANYTYSPNYGLTPSEILQFDGVDTLGEGHFVELGVRNKLQTKRGDRATDLADVDIFTYYSIERPDGEDAVEDIYLDSEFYPLAGTRLDLDGRFNVPERSLEEFNTRLWLWQDQVWSASLEQRYLKDRSRLWAATLNWKRNARWGYETFVRYEGEASRLEEYGGYVQRNYDCLSWRSGIEIRPGYARSDGSERDDEWRVMIEFWLTAFPGARMRVR